MLTSHELRAREQALICYEFICELCEENGLVGVEIDIDSEKDPRIDTVYIHKREGNERMCIAEVEVLKIKIEYDDCDHALRINYIDADEPNTWKRWDKLLYEEDAKRWDIFRLGDVMRDKLHFILISR